MKPAVIKTRNKDGERIVFKTLENTVYDTNGVSLSDKLNSLNEKIVNIDDYEDRIEAAQTEVSGFRDEVVAGKNKLVEAIINRGIEVDTSASYNEIAGVISDIGGLADGTADGTAMEQHVLKDYTIYARGEKVTGNIPITTAEGEVDGVGYISSELKETNNDIMLDIPSGTYLDNVGMVKTTIKGITTGDAGVINADSVNISNGAVTVDISSINETYLDGVTGVSTSINVSNPDGVTDNGVGYINGVVDIDMSTDNVMIDVTGINNTYLDNVGYVNTGIVITKPDTIIDTENNTGSIDAGKIDSLRHFNAVNGNFPDGVEFFGEGVVYGNGRYVAIVYNDDGAIINYSKDGVNWANATPPNAIWNSIMYDI